MRFEVRLGFRVGACVLASNFLFACAHYNLDPASAEKAPLSSNGQVAQIGEMDLRGDGPGEAELTELRERVVALEKLMRAQSAAPALASSSLGHAPGAYSCIFPTGESWTFFVKDDAPKATSSCEVVYSHGHRVKGRGKPRVWALKYAGVCESKTEQFAETLKKVGYRCAVSSSSQKGKTRVQPPARLPHRKRSSLQLASS